MSVGRHAPVTSNRCTGEKLTGDRGRILLAPQEQHGVSVLLDLARIREFPLPAGVFAFPIELAQQQQRHLELAGEVPHPEVGKTLGSEIVVSGRYRI